jgi:hypothetical protein
MSSEQPLGIKLQATDYRLKQSVNVNNTNVLEHKIIVFSLVATAHLQP